MTNLCQSKLLAMLLLTAAVICTNQLNDNVDNSSPDISPWNNLQMSRERLGYVEYGNFGVNIYQHVDNYKPNTTFNQHKYYYAPIALLHHESAVSKLNSVTNKPEMRFYVEMWNNDVRNKVVNWLSNMFDRQIKPNQVEVFPLDSVILTTSSPTSSFYLPTDWKPMNNNKGICLTLYCFDQKDCDQLADAMRSDPQQFHHFKLLFSLSLKTANTKERVIHIESVTSGDMANKLLQKFGFEKEVFLTASDEKKMITEMATNIRMDTFVDSDVVSPSSGKKIYTVLENMLIASRSTIKGQTDTMWDSVYWNDDNYRPDKTTQILNDAYSKKDIDAKKKLVEMYTNTKKGGGRLDSDYLSGIIGSLSLDIDFSDYGSIYNEDTDKFYKETKDHVEWNGEKFVPKPMHLSKINLANIRDTQLLQDKVVRVKYTTAFLTTPINFFQQEKLTPSHEWQKLKDTVEDLKKEIYERKNEIMDIGKMPTSCEDLQRMGHKISGIFLVKGSKKFEAVYCDFSPSENDLQNWIGYVDIKSSPVYFYVIRYDSFSTKSIPIPFQREVINSGNAIDSTSGIFKSRRSGTYFFFFTGLANFPASPSPAYLGVQLYLNGGKIGESRAEEAHNVADLKSQLTLQMTLNLKKGDKVWLEICCISPGVSLYDDSAHFTHFTGILLEEEFVEKIIA